jgi:integrase
VRELSERYSVGGVRLAYQYLNAAFQAAVTDGLIAKSPCQRIRLPMTEEAPVVTLADEQIQALRDAMPERYAAVVLLSADAGLRASEARAVTVDRVDFLRRTLTVDRQVDNAGAFVPLKTKSARRTVPLGDALLEVLAEHFRRFPSNSGFLVETSGGKPLRMQRLQTLFQRAVEKSGVRARFHDLRRHLCEPPAGERCEHHRGAARVRARVGKDDARDLCARITRRRRRHPGGARPSCGLFADSSTGGGVNMQVNCTKPVGAAP